ncbi:MAG: hypothetical protein GY757_53285, partial [bacterium]|nr:hypothetical protein [bacterium]
MRKQIYYRSIGIILTAIVSAQLFCCPAWGFEPGNKGRQYLVKHRDLSNGLPSNTIMSVAQTEDGHLWIATSKGLVRFDGIKCSLVPFIDTGKTRAARSAEPGYLFVDKNKILWIGSNVGLTSYDYNTGQYTTISKSDGLTDPHIRRIAGDMYGNLWVSFFPGDINRLSNGKIEHFPKEHLLAGKKINAIIEDEKGNLLFASREHGVY